MEGMLCGNQPKNKTIEQQQIKSLLDNLLDKTFHCNSEGVNLAVENLKSIFDLSASLSNLKISKQKTEENEPQWQKEIEKLVQPKT